MEVCERNSFVQITITISDAVTREERLKCEGEQIMKVIDSYMVCKEIFGLGA